MYAHTAAVITTPRAILTASGSSRGRHEAFEDTRAREEDGAAHRHRHGATRGHAHRLVARRCAGDEERPEDPRPAATEMKTAVSSGSPCGKMKRKKCQGPAYTVHDGTSDPHVRRIGPQDPERVHTGDARDDALQSDPRIVRPDGEPKLRIRVLVVVLDEVTVRVSTQLLGCPQLIHRLRVVTR